MVEVLDRSEAEAAPLVVERTEQSPHKRDAEPVAPLVVSAGRLTKLELCPLTGSLRRAFRISGAPMPPQFASDLVVSLLIGLVFAALWWAVRA